MRVLVYGDIGGSGGYHKYCTGIFGSGVWPADFETTLTCATDFARQLGTLDDGIYVVPHPWPASRRRALRYLFHLWTYPRLARRCRPAVEFYPSGNVRDFMRRSRSVSVCHNLLPFDELALAKYSTRTRDTWRRHRDRQGRMFERSAGVIFFSEFSRRVVTEQFPRIRHSVVIPHGVEDRFRRSLPRSHALARAVRLLYISPVYNYKHQCEVVKAVELLRRRSGRDVQLRLVGGGGGEDLEALRKVMDGCGADAFCTRLPFVGCDEVLRELREADLFVFASSCETFGITLLEAMASRLPVACSDRSGLPEILGDAGVYFDPADVESIASALNRLIGDDELRQGCGERAWARAANYTWQRSANGTVAYLREIATR